MWILLWMTTGAQAGGCRGAMSDAISAWEDLAVQIPTAKGNLPALTSVLDRVTDHTTLAAALRTARTRAGRPGIPTAIADAVAWLDANPDASGVDAARAALAAVNTSCTTE